MQGVLYAQIVSFELQDFFFETESLVLLITW